MKELKKEFKKKCKEEKAKSYKYVTIGSILLCVSIGFSILSMILGDQEIINLTTRIVFVSIGLVFLLIGGTISIIGEVEFSKKFKEYVSKKTTDKK